MVSDTSDGVRTRECEYSEICEYVGDTNDSSMRLCRFWAPRIKISRPRVRCCGGGDEDEDVIDDERVVAVEHSETDGKDEDEDEHEDEDEDKVMCDDFDIGEETDEDEAEKDEGGDCI